MQMTPPWSRQRLWNLIGVLHPQETLFDLRTSQAPLNKVMSVKFLCWTKTTDNKHTPCCVLSRNCCRATPHWQQLLQLGSDSSRKTTKNFSANSTQDPCLTIKSGNTFLVLLPARDPQLFAESQTDIPTVLHPAANFTEPAKSTASSLHHHVDPEGCGLLMELCPNSCSLHNLALWLLFSTGHSSTAADSHQPSA